MPTKSEDIAVSRLFYLAAGVILAQPAIWLSHSTGWWAEGLANTSAVVVFLERLGYARTLSIDWVALLYMFVPIQLFALILARWITIRIDQKGFRGEIADLLLGAFTGALIDQIQLLHYSSMRVSTAAAAILVLIGILWRLGRKIKEWFPALANVYPWIRKARRRHLYRRLGMYSACVLILVILLEIALEGDFRRRIQAFTFVDAGTSREDNGDFRGAQVEYSRALELCPHYAPAYFERGYVFYRDDDYDRAIADFSRALELDPFYDDAYLFRGTTFDEKGDHDGAIADFTSLLQFSSRLADDFLDLAYRRRGKARVEEGSYDEVLADLNAALNFKPNDGVALVSRGFVRFERGDYDRALQDFDTALQINGDFANAYAGRGYALHHKHDYKGAVAAYSKALQLGDQNWIARPDIEQSLNAASEERLPNEPEGNILLSELLKAGKGGADRPEVNPTAADTKRN